MDLNPYEAPREAGPVVHLSAPPRQNSAGERLRRWGLRIGFGSLMATVVFCGGLFHATQTPGLDRLLKVAERPLLGMFALIVLGLLSSLAALVCGAALELLARLRPP